MSFTIIAPATIAANTTGAPINLAASDVDNNDSGPDSQSEPGIPATNISPTMFLRFVMSGPTPASPANWPTLLIKCGTGAPTEITATYPAGTSLLDGTDPTEAASASQFSPDANNVYLVKVFIFIAGNPYQIQIKNNDTLAHDFLMVVAGTLSDSRQPWLDATGSVTYDMLAGEALAQSVIVNNKGTGPVSVNGFAPALTSPFSFTPPAMLTLPFTISPNPSSLLALPITFNAPAAPPGPNGVTSATTSIDSSDAGAGTGGGHNKAISLSATTRGLEVVLLLDDSGSMALAPDATTATASNQARWSELASASKLFLELLGGFGQGTGTFGIVKFPGPNASDLTTFDVLEPTAIPAATGMTTAKGLIDAITPFDNTPLGDGISRVLAPAISFFSTYSASGTPAQQVNRRWLLLFSDGKNNSGAANPRSFISPANGGTAAPGTSLADRRISVYSVAYGLQGSAQVDYQLMTDLASGSFNNGAYTQVDTAPHTSVAAMDLAQGLKNAILSGIVPAYTPADPRGVLALGGQAKYPVQITPFDERAAFVLSWDVPFMRLFTLSLITPLGEVITEAAQIAGVSFSPEQRYAIYQVEKSYLTNVADPTKPRFGTWTVVVTRDFKDIPESLRGPIAFEYSVLVRSRLRLDVKFDQPTYYAGDSVGIQASLVVDGAPLTGIQVTAAVDSPDLSADNFLAAALVTQDEYDVMKRKFTGQDVNAIYIKGLAAAAKGIVFPGTSHTGGIALTDPQIRGVYSGEVAHTQTPDVYKFVVEAVGQTPDGFIFRRESHEQIRVGVKPDAASTLVDLQLLPASGQTANATVRVIPRDRFGNVILLDPADPGSITFTTTAGQFTSPITTTFDGSYSQPLSYPADSNPVIGVKVWGKGIVHGVPVPSIGSLIWANHLISYHEGGQAVAGANQHADALEVLGDPVTKGPDHFVSLGAYGSLVVGESGTEVLAAGANDVYVVVHPDSDLRAYLVEAEPASKPGRWVKLGDSPGVTHGFSLKAAGVRSAAAIRITDKSGRTRDNSLKPSPTPGVSIRGVGFLKTGVDPYPPPPDCSDCLQKLCEALRKLCP
jgi:hypothetical protein